MEERPELLAELIAGFHQRAGGELIDMISISPVLTGPILGMRLRLPGPYS
jgi:hypothetical protein